MLVHVGARLEALVRHLASKGIAVRGMPKLLDGCMRVTIGRREHNECLVKALGEFTR